MFYILYIDTLFVVTFVSTILNEGAYLTLSIIYNDLIDGIFANLLFDNFDNLERASVPLLMLIAKPLALCFNVFGMTRPLSGIEPCTSYD